MMASPQRMLRNKNEEAEAYMYGDVEKQTLSKWMGLAMLDQIEISNSTHLRLASLCT